MKPPTRDVCPDCGKPFCEGYRVEKEGKFCWIWHEQRKDKRSRKPRDLSSVDNRYLALVALTNLDPESRGDDWNGFREELHEGEQIYGDESAVPD